MMCIVKIHLIKGKWGRPATQPMIMWMFRCCNPIIIRFKLKLIICKRYISKLRRLIKGEAGEIISPASSHITLIEKFVRDIKNVVLLQKKFKKKLLSNLDILQRQTKKFTLVSLYQNDF